MSIIDIKQDNLNKLESGLCVVDFWAEWCGPCLNFASTFEKVANKMSNVIDFYKINIDESSSTARSYSVRSIPTLLILNKGKEIARRVGSMSEQDLQQWIESNMNNE